MTSRRGWIALVLLLLFLAVLSARAVPAARAQQGVLTVAQSPTRPLPLDGEWGFAWQRFVDPAWQELPTRAFASVPGSWNDIDADGKPPGEDGWGSYVLRVDCPAGQSLALDGPHMDRISSGNRQRLAVRRERNAAEPSGLRSGGKRRQGPFLGHVP